LIQAKMRYGSPVRTKSKSPVKSPVRPKPATPRRPVSPSQTGLIIPSSARKRMSPDSRMLNSSGSSTEAHGWMIKILKGFLEEDTLNVRFKQHDIIHGDQIVSFKRTAPNQITVWFNNRFGSGELEELRTALKLQREERKTFTLNEITDAIRRMHPTQKSNRYDKTIYVDAWSNTKNQDGRFDIQ